MKILFILLSIVFVLLNVADVYTTKRILERGGTEKNPVIAKLIERTSDWGWIKMAIALVALFCIGGLFIAEEYMLAMFLIIVSDVVYLIVLISNLNILRR